MSVDAMQTGWNHAGIVQHEHIALMEKFQYRAKPPMLNLPIGPV